MQLISTGIFTLTGGGLVAHGKLGPWANLRCCCTHFGANPPAGETVSCVKAPFRLLATVLLPLTVTIKQRPACVKGQVAMTPRGSTPPRKLHRNSVLCKSSLNVAQWWLVAGDLQMISGDSGANQVWDVCDVGLTRILWVRCPFS